MTQRIETRAARLVSALEKAGHKVKRLTVTGDEIHVDFGEPDAPEIDEFDLIDMRFRSASERRAAAVKEAQEALACDIAFGIVRPDPLHNPPPKRGRPRKF